MKAFAWFAFMFLVITLFSTFLVVLGDGPQATNLLGIWGLGITKDLWGRKSIWESGEFGGRSERGSGTRDHAHQGQPRGF